MSIVTLDDFRADLLIRTNNFPVIFWVELAGEFGRIDQVTEHHGQLPSLSLWWTRSGWKCNLGRWLVAFFVHGKPFRFENFVFEVFEIVVIEVETSLQGAI